MGAKKKETLEQSYQSYYSEIRFKLRLESEGQFEKAAGFCIFHMCSFSKAINSLRESNDERLLLVAAALAGYLNASLENTENSIWKNMCQVLSKDMKDPYLRSIFSLIGSDMDYSDVLLSQSLSMCDKLGIALRYLDDTKVPSIYQNIIDSY